MPKLSMMVPAEEMPSSRMPAPGVAVLAEVRSFGHFSAATEVPGHLLATEVLRHLAAAVGKLGVVSAAEGMEAAGFLCLRLGVSTAHLRLGEPLAEVASLRDCRCAEGRRRTGVASAGSVAI